MPGLVALRAEKLNNMAIANEIASHVYRDVGMNVESGVDSGNISVRFARSPGEEYSQINKERLILLCHGHINGNLNFRNIEDLFDAGNGIDDLVYELQGHYRALLVNKRTEELVCINDKVSSHPWYLLEWDGNAVAAPESLCLRVCKNHGWKGNIDAKSLPEFIGAGHLYGRRSYFEDVQRLGPGEFATFKGGKWEVTQYWRPSFRVPFSREERKKRFSRALMNDIQRVPTGKGCIALSGGLDSRALVGLAQKANLDVEAVSYTWGTDIVQGSDAAVAKKIAKEAGIKWRLYQSSADEIHESILDVVRATGGESDVAAVQESFLGTSFYKELSNSYEYLLRGDEVWGWGDPVSSIQEAFFTCLLFNVDEFTIPQKLLNEESFPHFVAYIQESRDEEAAKYPIISESEELNDFKDYLYWRHRQARLIQNMAQFRHPFIPSISPFLFDETLGVVSDLPESDRIRKKLFVEVLSSMFPNLFAVGKDEEWKVPAAKTKKALQNDAIKEMVWDIIVSNPPPEFGAAFNQEAMTRWVEHVFDSKLSMQPSRSSTYTILHSFNKFLRRIPPVRRMIIFALRKIRGMQFPVVDANFLFRLSVLGLALREHRRNV